MLAVSGAAAFFSEAIEIVPVADNAGFVRGADLDSDGDLDLLALHQDGESLSWHEATDNGYIPHVIVADSSSDVSLRAHADFSGDGTTDLLVVLHSDTNGLYSIRLLLNDGEGDFTAETLALSEAPVQLQAVDMDDDGDLDVLWTGDNFVSWLEREGPDTWSEHTIATGLTSKQTTVGDIDSDGDLDLLLNTWDSEFGYRLLVAENSDNGYELYHFTPGIDAYVSAAIVDADNDGDADLVATWDKQIGLLTNEGDGSYSIEILHTFNYSTPYLRLLDVTNDGRLDLVCDNVLIRLADREVINTELPEHVRGDFVDIDADGDLDLLTFSDYLYDFVWHRNAPTELYVGAQYLYPTLVDEAAPQTIDYYFGRARIYGGGFDPADAPEPLTVPFTLTGEATLGEDFVLVGADTLDASGGVVTIPAGQRGVTLEFTTRDDSVFEIDERIVLRPLGSHFVVRDNTSQSTTDRYTLTIADDDPADFGDAPASYGVDRASGGARHGATGPRIGSYRDAETDGAPSIDALGDGGSNEGIVVSELHAGDPASEAFITVSGAPAGAYLDAWIDFDRDRLWAGPEERVATRVSVVEGENRVAISVPAWAGSGETFARFRLSTDGVDSPFGSAIDGEVEDVAVTLYPPMRGSRFFNNGMDLPTETVDWLRSAVVTDIDGDGADDLVSWQQQAGLVWRKNDGSGGFGDFRTITSDTSFYNHRYAAADLDGDGDNDIVGSNNRWYRNDSGNFTTLELDRFSSNAAIVTVDFDQDGDIDVLRGGVWFDNQGDGNFIEKTLQGVSISGDFEAVDMDRDGDLDLVGYARNAVEIHWYESHGVDAAFTVKASIPYESYYSVTPELSVADINNDGYPDILRHTGYYGSLAWLESDGAGGFEQHPIMEGRSNDNLLLVTADLDADGDLDVVTTREDEGAVGWYENLGEQGFASHAVTKALDNLSGIDVSDIDLDGDLDILAWGPTAYAVGVMIFQQVTNSIELTVTPASLSEDDGGQAAYTLRRTGPSNSPLDVTLRIEGTAESGNDYRWLDGATAVEGVVTLTFAAGETEKELLFETIADSWLESNETIVVSLLEGDEHIVGEAGSAAVVIVDDEPGDFGDAPATYPTLLADDGARHGAGGPRLGSLRTEETDGQPGAETADDDGLLVAELRVGDRESRLVVDVSMAPAGARLDAWVDFNGDGSWGGEGERIAHSLHVTEGENVVIFATPPDATSGETYARLRISTGGGLGFLGAAPDGEAEDHEVTILSPVSTPGVFGDTVPINGFPFSSSNVLPIDVDGDRDIDLIALSYGSYGLGESFFWLENDGSQSFMPHEYVSLPGEYRAYTSADLDGDGLPELILRSQREIYVYAYADGGFQLTDTLEAGRHVSSTNTYWITAADIDGDGDADLLTIDYTEGEYGVDLYENLSGEWARKRLAKGFYGVPDMVDWNGDGKIDLVAPAEDTADGGGLIALLNYGPAGFMPHRITGGSLNYEYRFEDIDGDGDIDIANGLTTQAVGGSRTRVGWFENTGNGIVSHSLLTTSSYISHFELADLDGDGAKDILYSYRSTGVGQWRRNLGAGEFARSRTWVESGSIYGDHANSPMPIDMDGDGDLDLVPTVVLNYPGVHSNAYWWQNLSIPKGDYNVDGVVDQDDYQQWVDTFGFLNTPRADGNGNGVIDGADFTVWRDHLGERAPAVDFDLSGALDSADLALWAATEGSTTDLRADANDDGEVDEQDLALWQAAFDEAHAEPTENNPISTPPDSLSVEPETDFPGVLSLANNSEVVQDRTSDRLAATSIHLTPEPAPVPRRTVRPHKSWRAVEGSPIVAPVSHESLLIAEASIQDARQVARPHDFEAVTNSAGLASNDHSIIPMAALPERGKGFGRILRDWFNEFGLERH
ncbi:FG-GAP-like repeat-containing protein [Pseudobythopirellula maris]|nr:FG-GAP-like repeat-containing protein [Pseudobythopirellula maris]